MLKWVILASVVGIVILLSVRIIKVMWKSEKDSKEVKSVEQTENNNANYVPQALESDEVDGEIKKKSIDDFLVTDFAKGTNSDNEFEDYDFARSRTSDGGFTDFNDDEFIDYSNHMRNGKSRPTPEDFDLDGDSADEEFEYIPNAPDFSYLQNRRQKAQKKTLEKSLNELSDEMKVLMISNLFDTKF